MTRPYMARIKSGLPLLLGGVFMVYLAVADNTIFDYILNNIEQTRLTVAAATVAASAPLMFFATGFFKLALFHEWQTIYQYEMLLRRNIFHILVIVLLVGIVAMGTIEGVHIFNIHIFAGCLGFSAYLITYIFKRRSDSV